VLQVVVDVPGLQVGQVFDFRWPWPDPPPAGTAVIVPWASQRRVGFVWGASDVSEVPPERLRDVIARIDSWPALPEPLLALARFASTYYHASPGEILLPSLPEPLRRVASFEIESPESGGPQARWAGRPRRAKPMVRSEAASWPALNADQQRAVDWLAARVGQGFAAALLFGVTGSGKTEVYLHAVRQTLDAGRDVLLLVPEIALTEGLARRVRERFPDTDVAVMTSGLADGARAQAWLAAAHGQARIVVGTRSAVFAPLRAPGLIIVDEEHDASYKQQDGVRLQARDLAVMRAHLAGCPVLLGSATPSLESWNNAQSGRYALLRLPNRAVAGARLPKLRVIDLRAHRRAHGSAAEAGPVSPPLLDALRACLAAGQQSLLFANRRGWAPALACDACGWVADCDQCSAHFALHRARLFRPQAGKASAGRSNALGYTLICHHCSAHRPAPAACPACGNPDLLPKGQGTQKIEAELAAVLPDARIARMDRDSTRRRGSGAALLADMDAGAIDVLVGTQMVAKGHDFPRLTLVGVTGTDSLLVAPDFRAEERLFALLMQVAGRAGRATDPGEVLVETRLPQHPLFAELLAQDYEAAAARLLAEREALNLPPYATLAVLRVAATSDAQAQGFLDQAREAAPAVTGVRIYHPVPAGVPRVANQARWQMLVEAGTRSQLQSLLGPWLPLVAAQAGARLRWHIDVDPIEV
jgi:primosomal protein N' (replication factor Y)